MSLSSLYIDAFMEVARLKSFSAAAKKLNITQSALSQRVANLEAELGSTVFLREASGVRLTDLGQRLLRYGQARESLEREFLLSAGAAEDKQISGLLRVAGFSTVNRAVVLPALAGLVRENPAVKIELMSGEMRELAPRLFSGAADLALLTSPINKQAVENELLGYEENVLIRPARKNFPENVFLDHDEEDTTTLDFFKLQGRKPPRFERHYLDEIYAIIDGVSEGLGQAVVPRHLAEDRKGIEIVSGYKPLRVPVYLCYFTQPFYTRLQLAAAAALKKKAAEILS